MGRITHPYGEKLLM